MATVRTPVEGFTGNVIGVQFVDGVGEAEGEAQLAYFERQGYAIGDLEEEAEPDNSLEGRSKAELEQIATDEGVEFKAPINKTELVGLIEAKRLAGE